MKHFIVVLLMCIVHDSGNGGPRVDMIINGGWRFASGDVANAAQPSFDDSGWESIDLPHTWNAIDGQDGGNDYRRGVGWYRKKLRLDSRYRGKALYLRFDGASTVAAVYVNGRKAGTHRGGFGAFCFDVSTFVEFTKEVVIAVRVSNAPDSTVPPLSGDFTVFGGIYRGVRLLVLDPVCISPLDYASPGIYIRQSQVTATKADLAVTTVIRNSSLTDATRRVTCDILNEHGQVVRSARSTVTIPPCDSRNALLQLTINSPHLWNGRTDPYLYTVVVSLAEEGKVCDEVHQPLGVRSFRVDPDSGFFLNGRPYNLHGVNRHQDREGKGWAIGLAEHKQDYRLIEEMGCTAVRLAHYQQAQEFYDLCDRGGMIVWAELSLVDIVNASPEFASVCRSELNELIKQNFNHPSIMFWSLANELIPGSQPEVYDTLMANLNALAHTLDPARLTALASRSRYNETLFVNTITDLVAYNVYKGWYQGDPGDFAGYLDSLHSRCPKRCIGIGEYGAGAGIRQHEIPPHKPYPGGPWHPEEWQSEFHEQYWNVISRRPYVWGSFVWNMFDFAVDGRNEGEHAGRNDKGLVTYDRKVRKDAFYWYKAHWTPEPMVHITSKGFSCRIAGTIGVRAYSNCDSLKLVVNGKTVSSTPVTEKVGAWDNLTLNEGTNMIIVEGISRGKVVRDSCAWTLPGR